MTTAKSRISHSVPNLNSRSTLLVVCVTTALSYRPKVGRDTDFESPDGVAALARLRDSGNRVVVGPRQSLAIAYACILCWVCCC
jgi:hypothetical protein